MSRFPSWGCYPGGEQAGCYWDDKNSNFPNAETTVLPYGLGRSYGTSCQNLQGQVVSSKLRNHFIAFDPENGLLHCEAGVTLAEILSVCLPKGWFLSVTPGTKFVTVAGAIANDVHGKNHESAGSFGCYVHSFELLRSDGERLLCSASQNSEWFYATIGGLGLTGFITSAVIQLKKVNSRRVESETIKYQHLNDFFTLAEQSQDYEYTAAWLDCLATGAQLGRGHFIRGNHALNGGLTAKADKKTLSVPLTPPISLINKLSLQAFNSAYYHRQRKASVTKQTDYNPFFYPLDSLHHWNRIYGKKGFLQYQCVIPLADAQQGIEEILQKISYAKQGSFLVVLKMMGNKTSGGLLSFPQQGATLALDFPFLGQKTLDLLNQLDQTVLQAKGRLYPAKDARMSGEMFRACYSDWQTLEQLRDPAIQSDFWRKVML